MPLENFRFFALSYLDDWFSDDQRFVAGLMPENETTKRLATLREAGAYYKVMRNFKRLSGEIRMAGALSTLDAVTVPVGEDAVDRTVNGVAAEFQRTYGFYAVSAASKFLWLRHQWPLVIYDDRAIKCLRKAGGRFGQCDYAGYRRAWWQEFAKWEDTIRRACDELWSVKLFSRAYAMAEDEFRDFDRQEVVSRAGIRQVPLVELRDLTAAR